VVIFRVETELHLEGFKVTYCRKQWTLHSYVIPGLCEVTQVVVVDWDVRALARATYKPVHTPSTSKRSGQSGATDVTLSTAAQLFIGFEPLDA